MSLNKNNRLDAESKKMLHHNNKNLSKRFDRYFSLLYTATDAGTQKRQKEVLQKMIKDLNRQIDINSTFFKKI